MVAIRLVVCEADGAVCGKVRSWGYRLLSYIDDFLLAPSVGRASTSEDCWRATGRIGRLMDELGVERHPDKGVWDGGARALDHLGMRWDSSKMLFTVTEVKQEKVRGHARELLREAARGRRWVGQDSLRSFAGVAVSLTLAMPLASFYCRSLYDAMTDYSGSKLVAARSGKRVRLSNREVKDLKAWTKLGEAGRRFKEETSILALHTDAAELGWGGTLGVDGGPGAEDDWEDTGVWTAEERKESITLRELRAVHLVLGREQGVEAQRHEVRRVKLYIDNMSSKYIIGRMVSKSRQIMSEVRILQRLLQRLGISIDPHWLPSAENYFADGLSRTWDPSDISVRASLRRELLRKYAHMNLNDDGCWTYRPLGIPEVAARKVALGALGEPWGAERARLYCPPVDMIGLTMRKM